MPGSEEETYSTIFTSLKHPVRRKILRMLSEKFLGFSEILEALGISSSHLTYHLENLGELVSKTEDGKYKLSTFGEAAVITMSRVEEAPKVTEPKRLPLLPPKWRSFFVVLMIVLIVFLVSSYVFIVTWPHELSAAEGTLRIRQEPHLEIEQSGNRFYLLEEDGDLHFGIMEGELSLANYRYLHGTVSYQSWIKAGLLSIWFDHGYSDLKYEWPRQGVDLTPYVNSWGNGNYTITREVRIYYVQARVYMDVPYRGLPSADRSWDKTFVVARLYFTLQGGNITSWYAETYPLELTMPIKLYNPSLIKLKDFAPNLLIMALVILSVTLVVYSVRVSPEVRDALPFIIVPIIIICVVTIVTHYFALLEYY